MRAIVVCIFFLTSCSSIYTERSSKSIVADSGSFIFLDQKKAGENGYIACKENKALLVYGLPFVDQDTILTIGEHEVLVLRKDYGESRIEISDQNLVSPKLADQERATAE